MCMVSFVDQTELRTTEKKKGSLINPSTSMYNIIFLISNKGRGIIEHTQISQLISLYYIHGRYFISPIYNIDIYIIYLEHF